MIKLGKLNIDPAAIGSQGNAILGIRDSGKTYTATWFAEQLHAAGIPFIAFDPIGVWRFLRVPGKGQGIPVVVAGGNDGDLPLTVAGAPEIVRAAMANGISLVIDLFDINLTKADWKRIVTASVRVLLHENSKHGLRHVFIEEAAEFAPQRVGPDQGHVYAEMEKLARMGGNARLGYTLINQRAEEVNKALLELCDNLFLHRQKGRNSLTALSKWLDIGNVAAAREIIASLPTLPTGECWAWLQGSEIPERVKIPVKNSLHPDRRIMRGDDAVPTKAAVDVGSFVKAMRGTLGDIEKEATTVAELRAEVARLTKAKPQPTGVPEAEVQRRIREAVAAVPRSPITVKHLAAIENDARSLATVLETMLARVREAETEPAPQQRTALPSPAPRERVAVVRQAPRQRDGEQLGQAEQRVLDAIAWWEAAGIESPQILGIALAARYTVNGHFRNTLGALRSKGLIAPEGERERGTERLTDAGRATASAPSQPPSGEELLTRAVNLIRGEPARRIFDPLIHGDTLEVADLAAAAGYTVNGHYRNTLGSLHSMGLIHYPQRGRVQRAPIFEVIA